MNIDKIEVDDEWEWYIGQLFFKLIEGDKPKCVLEIAPGFKYKVAYALKEIDFDGKLYIVDANPNVTEYVTKKYKQILPNAEIIGISDDFSSAIKKLPHHIDLFLANHIIDDMLIENYISKANYDRLFNEQEEGEKYLKEWQRLAENESDAKRVVDSVQSTFKELFDKKEIEKVVISQYRSNLFFLGRDENVEKVVRACFEKVKSLVKTDEVVVQERLNFYPFGEDERYLGEALLNNTQNATNWIVGKPRRRGK